MSKNGTGSNAENRRLNAAARKLVSDARTPQQQLARLDQLGLTAKKERAKLEAKIKAGATTTTKTTKAKKQAIPEVTGKVLMTLPVET